MAFFQKKQKAPRQDWKPHWLFRLIRWIWLSAFGIFKIAVGALCTVLIIIGICLVVLSGYLPLPDTTAAERSAANADVPIFMGHGTQDEMVVPARGEAARDALRALGYCVEWHSYPMGHSVCPEEGDDRANWLRRVLG